MKKLVISSDARWVSNEKYTPINWNVLRYTYTLGRLDLVLIKYECDSMNFYRSLIIEAVNYKYLRRINLYSLSYLYYNITIPDSTRNRVRIACTSMDSSTLAANSLNTWVQNCLTKSRKLSFIYTCIKNFITSLPIAINYILPTILK